MSHETKSYLGDGAYIQVGVYPGEYVLTTEDGATVGNTVVLGVDEIRALFRYVRKYSPDLLRREEGK